MNNDRLSEKEQLQKVENIYSFWGRLPSLYAAQDIVTFLGRAGTLRRNTVEKMKIRKGDKVLEIACGTGRNFPYIINAVGKEGLIYGLDYSEDMLNAAQLLCKRKKWDNIKLIQGDAGQLKISEKNFNGILCVLGISAIPGWEKTIDKCFGILCNGGKLVVCDARPFGGLARVINPIVKFIYSKLAAWDPSKNITGKMKETFGNVEIVNFNFNTFFIATSEK